MFVPPKSCLHPPRPIESKAPTYRPIGLGQFLKSQVQQRHVRLGNGEIAVTIERSYDRCVLQHRGHQLPHRPLVWRRLVVCVDLLGERVVKRLYRSFLAASLLAFCQIGQRRKLIVHESDYDLPDDSRIVASVDLVIANENLFPLDANIPSSSSSRVWSGTRSSSRTSKRTGPSFSKSGSLR